MIVFSKYLLNQIYNREPKLGLSEKELLLTNNYNGCHLLLSNFV